MSKIALSDLTNFFSSALNTISTNNAALREAFDNTLSRDGTSPNAMLSDLDMNGNQILNLPAAVQDTDPVRLGEFLSTTRDMIDDAILAVTGIAGITDISDELTGPITADRLPALTGDVTTTAGTVATTLATVNSNVGTFGSASQIPSFIVDGKGRITSVSNMNIAVPASGLTGTTLASNVLNSSLTSVGPLTSGSTSTGFTVDLNASTITGTLADARLPTTQSTKNFTAVGIGVGTPRNLEVSTSNSSTTMGSSANQFQLNARNSDSTNNNWSSLAFYPSTGYLPVTTIATQVTNHGSVLGNLVFYTDGLNERMRIASGGNITMQKNLYIKGTTPWADVTAYGAFNDGTNASTTYTAIANAVAAVSAAGGGYVFFPPGNYLTDTQLDIPSYVILIGSGQNTSAIHRTTAATVVRFVGEYCGARDIQIQGKSLNYTATEEVCRIETGSVAGNLYNCRIVGGAYALANAGVDWHLLNCYIYATGAGGAHIVSTGGNWYHRCKIDNSAPYTTWTTATAYNVGDLVIDTGQVYECLIAHTSGTLATDVAAGKWHTIGDPRPNYGVWQQSNGGGSVAESDFIGCDFTVSVALYAVKIDDSGTSTNLLKFTSCVFSAPILIQSARWTGFTNCELGGNITLNGTGTGAGGTCSVVGCYGFSGVTATGCTLAGNVNVT